jgi:hypothetical protein
MQNSGKDLFRVRWMRNADDHRYDRREKDDILYIITGGGGAPSMPSKIEEDIFTTFGSRCKRGGWRLRVGGYIQPRGKKKGG